MKDLIAELKALAKRSHPDKNPRINMIDVLEALSDRDDIFISMTDIAKIGVNPHTQYHTPAGIYTYPLKDLWDEISSRGGLDVLPSFGNAPYVNVLESKKIVDLEKYSKFKADAKRLQKKYGEELDNNKWDIKADLFAHEVDFDDDLPMTFKSLMNLVFGRPQGEAIWYLTFFISLALQQIRKKSNNAGIWNSLLRKDLKIPALVDHGKGIIHPSERDQAVFLSRNAFKLLGRLSNKGGRYEVRKRVGSFKKLFNNLVGDLEPLLYSNGFSLVSTDKRPLTYNDPDLANVMSMSFEAEAEDYGVNLNMDDLVKQLKRSRIKKYDGTPFNIADVDTFYEKDGIVFGFQVKQLTYSAIVRVFMTEKPPAYKQQYGDKFDPLKLLMGT